MRAPLGIPTSPRARSRRLVLTSHSVASSLERRSVARQSLLRFLLYNGGGGEPARAILAPGVLASRRWYAKSISGAISAELSPTLYPTFAPALWRVRAQSLRAASQIAQCHNEVVFAQVAALTVNSPRQHGTEKPSNAQLAPGGGESECASRDLRDPLFRLLARAKRGRYLNLVPLIYLVGK